MRITGRSIAHYVPIPDWTDPVEPRICIGCKEAHMKLYKRYCERCYHKKKRGTLDRPEQNPLPKKRIAPDVCECGNGPDTLVLWPSGRGPGWNQLWLCADCLADWHELESDLTYHTVHIVEYHADAIYRRAVE